MDKLCVDMTRLIVSFAEAPEVDALKLVCKTLALAAKEAPLAFEGPQNGNTFSAKVLKAIGTPTYMPFVTCADLSGFRYDEGPQLLRGLETALGNPRPLSVFLTHEALLGAGMPLVEILNQCNIDVFWYADFVTDDTRDLLAAMKFVCHDATMSSCAWGTAHILPNHLTLMDYRNRSPQSVARALMMPIRKITLYGVLDDAIMDKLSCRSETLTELSLFHQAINSWGSAPKLQRATPCLQVLEINGSNLISDDMDAFEWALWPSLHTLNFESNWTLRSIEKVPLKSLQGLLIANTGISSRVCKSIGNQLSSFSCDVQKIDPWVAYFETCQFESLSISFQTPLKPAEYERLWKALEGRVNSLHLELREFFTRETILNIARSILRSTHVTVAR